MSCKRLDDTLAWLPPQDSHCTVLGGPAPESAKTESSTESLRTLTLTVFPISGNVSLPRGSSCAGRLECLASHGQALEDGRSTLTER